MRLISLLVIGAGNVILILCSPLLLLLAVGVHGPTYSGMKLVSIYASLILIPISIIGAWVLYRLGAYGKAILCILLPLVGILMFIVS